MRTVQLFIPCFIDQLYPETAANTKKLLELAGCRVEYNKNQTCCGQPAINAGMVKQAKSVLKAFTGCFKTGSPVVSPGGSCTGFIRNYGAELLVGEEASRIAGQSGSGLSGLSFFELSEFLVQELGVVNTGAKLSGRAVYHDACGALRECHIKTAPRLLLEQVSGLTLIEAPDCETCCGFGGTFSVKFSAISTAMTEQKIRTAMETGADYIISTDYSCLMVMDAYIRQQELSLKVMHLADVLMSS